MTSIYHGADEAVLLWKPESGSGLNISTMPTFGSGSALISSAPSSPVTLGYVNAPAIKHTRSNGKGYSIGTPYAVYDKKGTIIHTMDLDFRIASVGLLPYLLRGSGGYKNLADLCFYYGVDNTNGDGFYRALRYAKCNSFQMTFQEGSAQELQGTANFMALYDHAATVTPPSESDIKEAGAPLFWDNVISVTVGAGSIAFRDRIMSLQISGNNRIEAKGHGRDFGDDDPRSRSHLALRPSTFEGTANLTLHNALDAALRDATVNASIWGDITIVSSNEDVTADNQPKTLTTTLHDCLLDEDGQDAKNPEDQLSNTVSIKYSKITQVSS